MAAGLAAGEVATGGRRGAICSANRPASTSDFSSGMVRRVSGRPVPTSKRAAVSTPMRASSSALTAVSQAASMAPMAYSAPDPNA